MEYSSLYELIRFLEYGTRLHIGVLFFGRYGGGALSLPHGQTIHNTPVCEELKNREGGLRRCFRCRQRAIEKAFEKKTGYGGGCINGVYEYMHPILIDGECAALVFIGNIRCPDTDARLLRQLGDRAELVKTMEPSFDEEACRALARLIESYVHALRMLPEGRVSQRTSPLIGNVRAYVAEHLEYEVSLSDAAHIFHYNEQYLGRLFFQETGMRFSEYLNGERVKRAAVYLGEGESVIKAAYQVGFRNVTYFNRVFKRIFGKTPTEYKRELRDKGGAVESAEDGAS